MYTYDLNTGEPSLDGSPSDVSEMSQEEIVNNANMMYDTDPNMRYQQIQQQQQMYNNGYGYGYNLYQQPYPQYQQQNPYYGYQQQPYFNPQSGFSGYAGNPAIQYMQARGMNPPIQQPMYKAQPEDYTYFVQGYNPGGSKMILPSNAEEICSQMQADMDNELEEDYMKRLNQQQEYYQSLGLGSNYYGMPYVQQQYNPSIINKYRQQIEEMRKQAEQTKVDLNKHLSKLCHNYLGDDTTDDDIDAIYDGYAVTVPGTHIQESREYDMLSHAVPIDTSIPYKQHAADVAAEYKKYVNDDTDMETFFEAVGEIRSDELLEEEKHRRRDLSLISMPTSTYRELIREKVQGRSSNTNGNTNPTFKIPSMNNNGSANIPLGESFPTLNEAARLLDDGTLEIHAPSWLGNKQFVIKNVNEDEYELHRRDFVNSIYGNQNPLAGGDPNGG